ncbi:MAG: hypothetical protein IGS23_00100 [Rivularia sp. T60_A2020_040]|nr:hypothetical protein [Rivularia sp. T60_A2020_040]
MNSNHEIPSYRDLRVWQKGMDIGRKAIGSRQSAVEFFFQYIQLFGTPFNE